MKSAEEIMHILDSYALTGSFSPCRRSGGVLAPLVGALTDVPTATVQALVESLHHDMVCAEDDFRHDLLPAGHHLLGLEESIRRSLADPRTDAPADPQTADPMGPLPQDPAWAAGGDDQPLLAKAADVVLETVERVRPDST